MSVIIRLQNLPWSSNALDIRRFFSGLSIPDGGVHIVGGDKGDAFIAFSTDEDARRAMMMDSGRLGGNSIKLLLSSKTEMQNVISVARGGPTSAPTSGAPPSAPQQSFNSPIQQQGGPPPISQQRYGPQANQPGYNQNQGSQYGAQGMGDGPPGVSGNISAGLPDQRQGMGPQYGSQPPQGMPPQMNQGRPGDRPMWDGPPANSNIPIRGGPMEYGRPVDMDRDRDMPPQGMMPQGGFDQGMPPSNQPYDNNMGPMNGSHMDGPPAPQQGPRHDYRDNRDFRDDRSYDYRPHSPGRDRDRYEIDRSFDDRRSESRKRPFNSGTPFVFISRMPPNINYKDVRKFFVGLEIPRDGLKLINDRKGRRVGDAYVKFSSSYVAEEALKFDGWTMGDSIVQVELASPEEFERAIDSYVPGGSPDRDGREHRGGNMNYGRGGMSYDRGGPMRQEPPPYKRRRSRSPFDVRKGDSCCVVVKNLPYKLEKRDLFRFFTGLKFAKGDTSVQIEEGPDGRPKGTALIEFFSASDVMRALSYHRKQAIGGRTVEVISIPVEEYKSRIAKYVKDTDVKIVEKDRSTSRKRDLGKSDEQDTKNESKNDPKPDKSDGKNDDDPKDASDKEELETKKEHSEKKDSPTDEKRYCVELRGVPFSANNQTLREFFSGLQIAQRGIHIVFKPDGNAAGPAFVEFISSEDCKKAVKRDKEYIGSRYIDVKPVTKKEMLEQLSKLQAKFKNPHHMGGPGGHTPSVAHKVGKPGCVVGVQNMHFSTTLEDILDFFRGFHPIADSVKMRYNQAGVPTGDAMVAFHNREDASRAARQLNKGKMQNRTINVYLA